MGFNGWNDQDYGKHRVAGPDEPPGGYLRQRLERKPQGLVRGPL